MRVRVVVVTIALLLLAGCGLTYSDIVPGGPSLAEKTFSGEREVALAEAIDDDDAQRIAEQLAAGANPEAVGTDRITMLQFAVERGSEVGVEKLLAAKVDPDTIGRYGQTALHGAVTRDSNKLIDLLLAGGAEVNARATRSGITPLHASIQARNPDRVRRLLAAGADAKLLTVLKETPAHEAGRINAGDLIIIVLDAGADPRAKNGSGATFQDYYFGYDKTILNDKAKAERQQVADWLRARNIPVDPRA